MKYIINNMKRKNNQFAEYVDEEYLKPSTYYIVRFDGEHMSKTYDRYKENFYNTMHLVFDNICKEYKEIVFGYETSDEISVIYKTNKTANHKNNRRNKILSLISSKLSVAFYKSAKLNKLELKMDPAFDARIIKIPREMFVNYFLSRQYISYAQMSSHKIHKCEFVKYEMIYFKTKTKVFEFAANESRLTQLIDTACPELKNDNCQKK